MKDIIPTIQNMHSNAHPTAQVLDIVEEKKIEREALALVELHDFIKSHPDSPVKEISKFMPPVDSRAVSKAIQLLALRDEKSKDKKTAASTPDSYSKLQWGVK